MMRLLLDLPTEGGYFRPLADHPTMAQALWATLHELRMAGVRPDALKPEVFSSPAKHAELVALLSAYEHFLEQNKRADMAAVYEEAVKHQDWCPIKSQDCWTELPDVNWSPLQRLLIDSMPGERLNPRAFELSGVRVPRRLKSLETERSLADADDKRVGVFDESGIRAAADFAGTRRSRCSTPAATRRRSKRSSAGFLPPAHPLDQVEIACASDAHVALIWEKALRHNWPVTLGPGIPATFTRPGRALIGLCDWIETDFSAGHLRRLLQSGDLAFDAETEGFTAGQAARLLGRAEAGWGRATYGLALGRLQKSYESRSADQDASDEDRADAKGKAERTAKILAWITGLLACAARAGARRQGSAADCGERRSRFS